MHIDGHITRSCRPKGRRAVSLTALIDVIFLLVLFFMLSSTFTRFAKVYKAGKGNVVQTKKVQTLNPEMYVGRKSTGGTTTWARTSNYNVAGAAERNGMLFEWRMGTTTTTKFVGLKTWAMYSFGLAALGAATYVIDGVWERPPAWDPWVIHIR